MEISVHNPDEGCEMIGRKKKKILSDEELFNILLNEILDYRAKKIWERIKDM